jgi:hypothetical protein
MTVTPIPTNGNSSKFNVATKQGEFMMALSFTLRKKIWQLQDDAAELTAAEELAEAIVSRHDPALPFKPLYILAEHNTQPTLVQTVHQIRKTGYPK